MCVYIKAKLTATLYLCRIRVEEVEQFKVGVSDRSDGIFYHTVDRTQRHCQQFAKPHLHIALGHDRLFQL